MLRDALNKLSLSNKERRQKLADSNARIAALETQLKLPHEGPYLGPRNAADRLRVLEEELAANPPPALPTATANAPAVHQVELTGDSVTDGVIKASGAKSLHQVQAALRLDHLTEVAANLPEGSMARRCADRNVEAARAALNRS